MKKSYYYLNAPDRKLKKSRMRVLGEAFCLGTISDSHSDELTKVVDKIEQKDISNVGD